MANYGSYYAQNFSSQPQQYSTGTYVSPNTGTYGYSTQQPSRVVTGYQTAPAAGATAYATTGYQQASAVQAAAAPTTGGYGYFQRASDSSGYAGQKQTGYAAAASQAYGYANTVKAATYAGAGTTVYPKQSYAPPAASSAYSGYSVQKPAPSYNNASYQKPKAPPRPAKPPQQLHYCDVCKISCGGPQTYKEHLEGQKHKKKAASVTSDTKNLAPGTYKCELCDVVCTGKDAFMAHVKGASHQKTVKLHQKLGKPIPEIKIPDEDPKKNNVVKTTAPKMNFVGGSKLAANALGGEVENISDDIASESEAIGENYVEEVKSDAGKVIGYKCTICDCRFNDVVAKNAHVKGKRHKLSYKKKVDPSYVVDVIRTIRQQRERRLSNLDPARQEIVWKQRQQEQMRWEQELRLREEELRRWEHEEIMRRSSEDRYWTRPDRQRMHELEYYEWERRERYNEPQHGFGPQGPPPPTPDDRLVMAKHGEIYPTEVELKQVQNLVASAEKALKLVSDAIGDQDKKETKDGSTEEATEKDAAKDGAATVGASRMLKGVMRVGALAKGLLLRGQLEVELVVLCATKPTLTLLTRVGKLVPEKLKEASAEEKYNMTISSAENAIFISTTTEPKCQVKVTLTSPAMREEDEKTAEGGEKEVKTETVDSKDVLDKEKALQALAALRRAKWFQARANHLTSCVITIRILRDLCSRVPAFKPLDAWAIELLCEKALASNFQPLGPGEAFRRVLETISSGIFLPGGCGLTDPCEKEKTDASGSMSPQEREDITAAAQQALRLHAFRSLHKILGIEPLKPAPKPGNKRSAEDAAEEESAAKVVKKSE